MLVLVIELVEGDQLPSGMAMTGLLGLVLGVVGGEGGRGRLSLSLRVL